MPLSIKNFKAARKTAKFTYPSHPEFNVELAFLPNSEWQAVRRECVRLEYDKKHQMIEVLDENKWMARFTENVFVNWEGLTFGTLLKLAPVEFHGSATVTDDSPVPFSPEFAQLLMTESREFAEWVMAVQDSYENFVSSLREVTVKN